jgi:hypothetical protein
MLVAQLLFDFVELLAQLAHSRWGNPFEHLDLVIQRLGLLAAFVQTFGGGHLQGIVQGLYPGLAATSQSAPDGTSSVARQRPL